MAALLGEAEEINLNHINVDTLYQRLRIYDHIFHIDYIKEQGGGYLETLKNYNNLKELLIYRGTNNDKEPLLLFAIKTKNFSFVHKIIALHNHIKLSPEFLIDTPGDYEGIVDNLLTERNRYKYGENARGIRYTYETLKKRILKVINKSIRQYNDYYYKPGGDYYKDMFNKYKDEFMDDSASASASASSSVYKSTKKKGKRRKSKRRRKSKKRKRKKRRKSKKRKRKKRYRS